MAVYERSVSEPLCLSFEVYQKPEEPGRIRWIEDWDMSAEQFFLEQLSKDYYIPYLEATRHMFLEPYTYEFYERLAPEFSYTAKIGTLY
ncbi:putative dimeric alpha-beta barrel protein [Rosellinia necatrix]|uniref:Putative dimeric alpha-beta barrel protein n=1 Tax=Rosellinia necatrix TaxID=77044 RepID=A0A1S8AC48_ROSNE|nr:putative dimeric alpha-beta barrel protein [Rosellinia necatrix]